MLGKDIQPGDLMTFGLVVRVDKTTSDSVWERPNVTFLSTEDAYYGPVSGELDLEREYNVLHEQGTVAYNEKLNAIMNNLYQYVNDRYKDINVIYSYLER